MFPILRQLFANYFPILFQFLAPPGHLLGTSRAARSAGDWKIIKALKKHVFSISRRPDLPGIFPTGQLPGSSRARKKQIFGKEIELISFPFFPLFARILFLQFLEFFEFLSCNYFRATDGVARGHSMYFPPNWNRQALSGGTS